MKIWKRNAIIASVLLLVCAGVYLNWSKTQKTAAQDLTETLSAEQVMNFPLRCLTGQGTLAVDGFAQYVKHPAKRCFTDWYLNAGAGRLDRHAA